MLPLHRVELSVILEKVHGAFHKNDALKKQPRMTATEVTFRIPSSARACVSAISVATLSHATFRQTQPPCGNDGDTVFSGCSTSTTLPICPPIPPGCGSPASRQVSDTWNRHNSQRSTTENSTSTKVAPFFFFSRSDSIRGFIYDLSRILLTP